MALFQHGYAFKCESGKSGVSTAKTGNEKKAPFGAEPVVAIGYSIQQTNGKTPGNVDDESADGKQDGKLPHKKDLHPVAQQGANESAGTKNEDLFH